MSHLPRRILMSLDSVGGVFVYALGLARALQPFGVETVFAGFGPAPDPDKRRALERVGRFIDTGLPLDWLVADRTALDRVPTALADIADRHAVDLLHLNLPTEAAGLKTPLPVVVVSHSCTPTWFRAVKQVPTPPGWAWQEEMNREGLARADLVIAPSLSHAAALRAVYGPLPKLRVVPNAVGPADLSPTREPVIFAAGRWWDEAKNLATLDLAARDAPWPVLIAGSLDGPDGTRRTVQFARPLGEITHAEVTAAVAHAGIFVSPSLYEPFGLAALEAAATGAALVLADIPTYRELWEGAAVFAAPRDPSAFTAAFRHLAANPALRDSLGTHARERARALSPAAQANAVLAAYGHLTRLHEPAS